MMTRKFKPETVSSRVIGLPFSRRCDDGKMARFSGSGGENGHRLSMVGAPFFTLIMMAMHFALVPVSPAKAAPLGVIEDIRIGEKGRQTRVAVLCEEACVFEKQGSAFLLRGAYSDVDLDLRNRAVNIAALKGVRHAAGALLRVTGNFALEHVNTKSCTVGGRVAACLDLFFSDKQNAATAPRISDVAAVPTPTAKRDVGKESAATDKRKDQENDRQEQTATLIQPPPLRETSPERLRRFARLVPTTQQPAQSATLAKIQPARRADIPSIAVTTPEVKPKKRSPQPIEDYAMRVETILGVTLTNEYCLDRRETLMADPWALDAMVDVGLCSASRGDMTGAEDILKRLLDYTPDKFEAHVGRALIAEQAGEKSVAKLYFQSALDALPPIEESNRIVQAMNDL